MVTILRPGQASSSQADRALWAVLVAGSGRHQALGEGTGGGELANLEHGIAGWPWFCKLAIAVQLALLTVSCE